MPGLSKQWRLDETRQNARTSGRLITVWMASAQFTGLLVLPLVLLASSFQTMLRGQPDGPVQATPILQRVVTTSVISGAPIRLKAGDRFPCYTAIEVGWSARIPMGCEDRVETALASSPSVPSQVLTGMTVFEAMNAIVQAHPGYAWTERDNVIEIRPEVSKDGGDLFLGHEVPAVAIGTRSGLLEVFQFISRLFGRPVPSLGSVDTRPFDLRFRGGSLVDLLNAAVRAHGEMAWHVTNVRPGRSEDILDDQFYLEMLPVGGGGVGNAFPRRPTP